MPEYRPVPRERADEFGAILRYSFAPNRGPPGGPDDLEADEGRWSLGDPRGIFGADDALYTTARHFYWPVRLRGRCHRAAGLSMVATPPEYRHRGYVGDLLEASLEEYRDEDVALSLLYPFAYPFYGKYGWRVGAESHQVTFEPDALEDAVPEPAGTFRRLTVADALDGDDEPADGVLDPTARTVAVDALDAVYEQSMEGYALAIDRPAQWWRYNTLHSWREDPFLAGWFDDDDELRAYAIYRVIEPDEIDGRRLLVQDSGATDTAARRQLLRFYYAHASQVTDVRARDAIDRPWLDLGADPRAFEVTVRPGIMVRLVDVAHTLEATDYVSSAEADLVLEVADDHAPWNDGRFHLEVADGDGQVTADTTADPAVTVDVGTLSQLVVGYRPVDVLEDVGDLEIRSAAARQALADCFPPELAYLPDGF